MVNHWLARVVRKAGVPGADKLKLDPDTGMDDAWTRVTGVCKIDDHDLSRHVANASHCKVADLNLAEPHALTFITEVLARQYGVFPLRQDYGRLVIAVSNPRDLAMEQAIAFLSGRTPVLEIASPKAIAELIDVRYSADKDVERLLLNVKATGSTVRVVESIQVNAISAADLSRGPVVRLTNLIISEAVEKGASDIHVQPSSSGGSVRLRIDGILSHYMNLPIPAMMRVISRIKVMASMDITDRLRPQDGRARIALQDKEYDLRISTVPTRLVEKAVIRILRTSAPGDLSDIGFFAENLAAFRRLLQNRHGIVVITGPTGSGKTTTVYAALKQVGKQEVNVMTVEDPVEYQLAEMTQIQVEPRQGVTFASALRAILRQDPDIIFIGEIRDSETAEIAVQASRTGHLVLATLHTNDAIGAIRRFADLGLDPSAIADTLRGAISQRLVRRVCANCSTEAGDPLSAAEERLQLEFGIPPNVRAYGCEQCNRRGFRGRFPVAEVLEISPNLAELIAKEATSGKILQTAIAAGMKPLMLSALDRVRSGETTLEEIERAIGSSQAPQSPELASQDEPDETLRAGGELSEEAAPAIIVDDDGATRTITRALLEKEGYAVTEATDGATALELVKANIYSLMVLDLNMPQVDGREVLDFVRREIKSAGMPVIVITGSEESGTETELIDAGADDYIRKPLDPSLFLSRVKGVMRRCLG